ncbi:hypothetical protein IQ268_01950 [Oculatella sp. LEGE 06141]|nr:hypothetical protein [Oculatella sp. LEGE 06141]
MPSLNPSQPEPHYLEYCVRSALAVGELSPAVESHIKRIVVDGNLTPRDRTLLDILRDAIQDGCVRRIQ